MVRIAICDNEVASLEALFEMVRDDVSKRQSEEFFVRRFHSSYDLLECLENANLGFDVYFLSMYMPMYSGIDIAREIRKNDEMAVIVYIAKNADNMLDAMETTPLHYLIRPIDSEKLKHVLDSALRRVESLMSKKLIVKQKEGLSNIGLHQIEYVEYNNHRLSFYLRDGRVIPSRVILESFSHVAESALADPRFLKPHASYVINMDHVSGMNSHDFIMNSGARVPISKRVYKAIRELYIAYMENQNGAMVI